MSLKLGSQIGIIGGGQLGRMMAMAASRLGYKTAVLDPQPNAPAFQCSNEAIVAEYGDLDALSKLQNMCDIITYEFENVDLSTIQKLENNGKFYPPSIALETSQDRLVEKTFFNDLGIDTAPWAQVDNQQTLIASLENMGGNGIIKTRRFGYDGKGQHRVKLEDDTSLKAGVEMLTNAPCILEGLVPFEREISIIAARSTTSEVKQYDLVENVHKQGILHTSTVPANVDEEVIQSAKAIAEKVLNALEYTGILAIEFFQLDDGRLLVNEFAPRVHNSGHWSEAACSVSQFEQHIRAIAGLPLADTDRHSDCVMENLIGDDVNKVPDILKLANTKLHLYGKEDVRAGRKMGHFTTLKQKTDKLG